MGLKFISTGSYLPKKIVSNTDLEKIMDTSDEWIQKRTGIIERRYVEKESTSDLAYKSAADTVSKISNPERIKLIVTASFTPDYIMPNISSLIHNRLGLPENVLALDINMACSGFCGALKLAESMLNVGELGVIIGSEVITKHLNMEDRSTAVLFGDGAGAAVVEKTDEEQYFDFGVVEGYESLMMHEKGCEEFADYVTMNGKEVFRFAVKYVPKTIDKVLEMNGTSLDEIDHIVLHQANKRIIEHVAKIYKLDSKKFFMNLSKYANTSAATIPIALDEMNQDGLLKSGEKILVAGFGAGLSYCSTIITW